MAFQYDDERKVDGRVILNGDGRATVTLPKRETNRTLSRFWHASFADVVNSDVLITYKENEILIRITPPEKKR